MKKRTIKKYKLLFSRTVLAALVLLICFSIKRELPGDVRLGFDKPRGFSDFYSRISTSIGQEKSGYRSGYQLQEFRRTKNLSVQSAKSAADYNWVLRGPGNVSGRTREVIIDPDDPTHNTWYAAAASGGIWKTTNGGKNWENLTSDLINLATNSLAMAPSNHNILYAGTGEGYGGFGMVGGSGIFKSTNRGNSWTLLESTQGDMHFKWINKIVVAASDANQILVATNEGIFKSYDGGISWDSVYCKGYSVQDLQMNPWDPNTVYAAVNSLGIIKSYNFGSSWKNSFNGIGTGYRFAVTVSPADTNYVFCSVEAPNLVTDVYISKNAALTWSKLKDNDFTFIDFLGEQGWFNNVIEADPFDKEKVYIGGVYLGRIQFGNGASTSDPQVLRVDTFGTGAFMQFVNFQGDFLRGGLTTGLAEDADVEEEDFVSVEVRFGPGMSQKAHRFSVPEGEGAGVPYTAYTYEDYVDVPFEVWDTDNNRQLMVSFRDQNNNGAFDLIEREWDDEENGREYVFVEALDYASEPNEDIAVEGGHYYKLLYFFWPTLPEDKEWKPESLPASSIQISYGSFQLQEATTTVLADANRNENLHVDHHDIDFAITDSLRQEYLILDANDGGLGVSTDKGASWEQIASNYPTTQFYGVAKKPGANEFIGGMQDNGTWQSPWGKEANAASEYSDRIAGDGFEALWHPQYPQRMLGSSYYNLIRVTTDGGENWEAATEGITGDGPFITRLSNSPKNPDLVFAVGSKGVYRHKNFGIGRYPWEYVQIDTAWAILDQVTSSHCVEVSQANPAVVWAGAGMFNDPDLRIFLSKDYGKNFEPVNIYPDREMGYITALATHPHEDSTAYVLFSMDHKPKILRTQDFGETWDDISGFGADSTSSSEVNFPDVMVYSLLVFPESPHMIWAGTEIGIFESIDNGASWHRADIGFPAVSVWQMFIQDNTLVVATHGRGIWTCTNYTVSVPQEYRVPNSEIKLYPNPAHEVINVEITTESDKADLKLFNTVGKQVYSEQISNLSFFTTHRLNLAGLPSGLYYLSVMLNGEQITQQISIK